MDRFRNKQVGESYYIQFDFSAISSTLTLSSAVVTAKNAADGTDVTATLTTVAKQLITSPVVYVWVTGGTDGVDYEITCKATASDGAVYELEGYMLVTDTLPITSRFRNKQVNESYYVEFDFASISSTLTLSSAAVTAEKVSDGTDATATLTTVAKQLITSPCVYAWVTGGTDGVDYRITCRATASDGAVYELEGLMLVEDVPAPAVVAASSDDDIFTQAMSHIFATPVGCDASYHPADGSAAIPCRVILSRSVLMQPSGLDAQAWERGNTIEAILSDIGGEPARGATFTIGTETFTVKTIDQNDGITVTMIVT